MANITIINKYRGLYTDLIWSYNNLIESSQKNQYKLNKKREAREKQAEKLFVGRKLDFYQLESNRINSQQRLQYTYFVSIIF